MANLFGQNIGTNYKGILNLNTLNGNLSGTLESVTDGDGNASALQLSTSLSRISANLTIGGSTTASARLHVRGDGTNPIGRFEDNTGQAYAIFNNFSSLAFRGLGLDSGNDDAGIGFANGGSYRFTIKQNSGLLGFNAISPNGLGYNFGGSGLNTDGRNSSSFFNISTPTINYTASANNYRPLGIFYTINNSGAQTGTATGIFLNATETALNGMTHNLMDLQRGGVSQFLINRLGQVTADAFIANSYLRGRLISTSGIQLLEDASGGTFNRLQFGGTTNSFPALKRNGAALEVRLADDSGFASLQVGEFRNNGNFNIYRTDGYYVLNYGNSGNVLDFNPSNGSSLTIRMRGQTIGNLFYIKTNEDRIGIGTDTPNASAILDISTTTKGFLPPRGSNAQMLAIATPATGLVFYDTTNNKLNVYDGTNWVAMH